MKKERSINIRLLILCFLLLIVAYVFFMRIRNEKKSQSLNLILISIDTLRPDHMGVYGYKKNTTPNIDEWAKNATVFTNASTVVPLTYPSFVALLTGKDPLSTRITNIGGPLVSNNVKTLTKILKERGFSTAAFLTNRVIETNFANLNIGFDVFKEFDASYIWKTKRESYNAFVDSGTQWLEKNKDKKLFYWIHLMDPHGFYYPPDKYKCIFNQQYCSVTKNLSMQEVMNDALTYQDCLKKPAPKEKIELFETLYDGDIAQGDVLVGKILKKIKDTGLDKNSLIVFYSDHGEGFDHNYYFTHGGVLYNSNTQIPLIIKYPLNKTYNQRSNLLIQNTDILPTLLDLLGIKDNTLKTDGTSFSSVFNTDLLSKISPKEKRKYSFMSNYLESKFAISDGNYKYIYSTDDACLLNGQKEELYNIKDDPNETTNINTKDTKKTQELKTLLLNYLSTYNLPTIKKDRSDTDIFDELKTIGY